MAKKQKPGTLDISDDKIVSLANRNLWFGPQSKVSDAQFRLAQESAGGKGGDDYTEEDDKKVKIPEQPWEDGPSGGGSGGGGVSTAGTGYLNYLVRPQNRKNKITMDEKNIQSLMGWQQPIFGYKQAQQQGLLGPGMGSPMSYEDYLALSGLLSPLGANTIA